MQKTFQEKLANIANIYIRQYLQTGYFENSYLKQVFIQKYLESTDLSATHGTFVTNGEIEIKFYTTHTEEPKLNHWVNTALNQLVMQFEPSNRCISKFTLSFTFFLKIKNSDSNLLKRGNIKKLNSHGQDTCGKKYYSLFL